MGNDNKILRYCLNLTLICIGIVIGVAIRHQTDLSSAESINLIDLFTLVATIIMAVYIPEVLDRKQQSRKDKKHLLAERIGELQSLYRKINLLAQGEKLIRQHDHLILLNTLDICKHKLDTIVILMTASKFSTSFDKEVKELEGFCLEHSNLAWSPQKVGEGFNYPDDMLEKEEVLYNNIDKATCLMLFKISEV